MSKKDFENLTMRERSELAAQVKRVRLELGLTQQDVATTAGVTRQSVGNLESGITIPQAKTLTAILNALGITPKAAEFSAETSRWLAIVGGIMDSMPASHRDRAGQSAVTAVTTELVRMNNVGGRSENVDLHEIDVTKLALAATHDTSSVEIDKTPDYENESQDPDDKEKN